MYKLKESMTDRIEFDRMARVSGRDGASGLNDEDLARVDAVWIANQVFDVDVDLEILEVDDVDEARARFVSAFALIPKGEIRPYQSYFRIPTYRGGHDGIANGGSYRK